MFFATPILVDVFPTKVLIHMGFSSQPCLNISLSIWARLDGRSMGPTFRPMESGHPALSVDARDEARGRWQICGEEEGESTGPDDLELHPFIPSPWG